MTNIDSHPLKLAESDLLDGYLSRAAVAKAIDRNERTLLRWSQLGVGPPVTLMGKTPMYRREAFRQWLLAQERQPVRPKRPYRKAPA